MKVKEVLSLLKNSGWYVCRMKGSHRQLKNPQVPGTLTIAGHKSKNVHPKILSRIQQQASWEK